MKQILKLLVAVLLMGSAYAEEYECCEPCECECVDECGYRFYAGVLGGGNWLSSKKDNTSLVKAKLNYHPGWVVGAFAGWQFSRNWSLEGELAFRHNDIKDFKFHLEGDTLTAHLDGHTETFSAMVNLYYDMVNSSAWTPYFGFGLGYAHITSRAKVYNTSIKSQHDRFAEQFILGLGYALSCETEVALEARYFSFAANGNNGSLVLSLKRNF